MDRIRIRGGRPLHGTITISGAKNAALPLQAAALLTDEPLILANAPELADVVTMNALLRQHGVDIVRQGDGDLRLHAQDLVSTTAPYDLVRKMRASVLVLGPLVARWGEARVSLPGGCAIGTRPVDLHIEGLRRLGATIEIEEGYIRATAPKGLAGARIVLDKPSVGATENLLMAASLARGESLLLNVAREPEIVNLAECLVSMGALIEGAGTDRLRVQGVDRLAGGRHTVMPDRIETGTYAMAAVAAGGEVELTGTRLDLIASLVEALRGSGVVFTETEKGFRVSRVNGPIEGVDIMTEPFPGFPTDLQAQTMALMTTAKGASMITETIFENRFMHVPELLRMGANITVHGSSALIRGVPRLTGAQVMATDLRASVSLVIAGLVAEGDTILNRVYHLDRGYERLEEKLTGVGAEIERLSGGE